MWSEELGGRNPQLQLKLQQQKQQRFLGFNREVMRAIPSIPPQCFKPHPFSIRANPSNCSHPRSPFPPRPISCSLTPNNHKPQQRTPTLLKTCAEGSVALLVGSLLLFGRFRSQPALALPAGLEGQRVNTQKAGDDGDEMYAKILEGNPKDVEALKVVLYGKMRKGKTAEAVDFVERLIALEPEEVEWRLMQALSYELMGQLAKAKRLFKDILKERPLLLRALHGLALAMHKNREGSAVFEMLNKALELARQEKRVTEERNIKILVAQMHVVKGDLEVALRQFEDLVDENPRDFRPYLCQGIVYSLLGKKKEADEQFEIYRGLVPDEFPQRGFIDDAILAAKTESQEQI